MMGFFVESKKKAFSFLHKHFSGNPKHVVFFFGGGSVLLLPLTNGTLKPLKALHAFTMARRSETETTLKEASVSVFLARARGNTQEIAGLIKGSFHGPP